MLKTIILLIFSWFTLQMVFNFISEQKRLDREVVLRVAELQFKK